MSSFVDSKHQKLSQDEIIAIAAKETGSEYTANQIKASLSLEAYHMKALMLREGNTIFVVHPAPVQATVGIFRAINADTIPNYKNNCVVFTKAVGMAGFKQLVTQFSDKALLPLFKYVYRHAPFDNMGYNVKRTTDGGYQVVINLGDVKKSGLPDKSSPPPQGGL